MKKKFLIVTSIVLLILFTISLINFSKTPISADLTLSYQKIVPPKFVAHRGLSSYFPENTLPAIQGAVDAGFYGVEFDIHTTKDGVWILNHDSDIDKMTDGTGNIADMTFDELQKFTVDNGNRINKFNNLKLPKLEDALKIFSGTIAVPFIEIKGYDITAFSNLLALLDDYKLIDRAVIISFDMEALLGIRELNKNIKLMYLTNNLTKEDVDICIENGNIGVDVNFGNIFKMKDALDYARENYLEVGAWTVDIPIAVDFICFFAGVKYVTTNRIVP